MATQRERWQDALDSLLAKDLRHTSSEINSMYRRLLVHVRALLVDYVKRYEELPFYRRLEVDRLFVTAADLEKVLGSAGVLIEGTAVRAGQHGYASVQYVVQELAGIAAPSLGLDRRYIEALVRQPVAGKTLSQRLYTNRDKLARSINENVARGIIEGRGYKEIARRVTEVTEVDYRRTLVIAQTEAGRARSEATQTAYEDAAAADVGIEKRWMATLDSKTRDDHRALDGQTVPYDGVFTIRGYSAEGPRMFGVASEDIRCRCTTEPIVDGEGAEERIDHQTGKPIKYRTYREWSKDVID